MRVLLVGEQPVMLRFLVAYAEQCSDKISFIIKECEGSDGCDAVLIDAHYMRGARLRKYIRQYKDFPVFILADEKAQKVIFGVNNIAGVFGPGVGKEKILQGLSIYFFSEDVNQGEEFNSMNTKERIVLDYLCQGLSNKEIAFQLDAEISTIKYHVRNLCFKLGVRNRTQAALKALKTQL